MISFEQETNYLFICNHCHEGWKISNVDENKEEWWCPHCGKSQMIPVVEEKLVKSNEHIKYEDNQTSSKCSDGGWWNPIKEECMGTGQGFNPNNV